MGSGETEMEQEAPSSTLGATSRLRAQIHGPTLTIVLDPGPTLQLTFRLSPCRTNCTQGWCLPLGTSSAL